MKGTREFLENLVSLLSETSKNAQCQKRFSLGNFVVEMKLYFSGYISSLIAGAFIETQIEKADFTFSVYMRSDFDSLMQQIVRQLPNHHQETPYSFELTNPFRVLVLNSQGQIYLYNSLLKSGCIILRDSELLDQRSYITPFRMIFSWMADSFEGEILHASGIAINGKSIIISGAKGSGKSTLALFSAIKGVNILSDDALLLVDNQIYAIYSRAKIEEDNIFTRSLLSASFELINKVGAKRIFPLTSLNDQFVRSAKVSFIAIPKRSEFSAMSPTDKKISLQSFLENSLREIFGGEEKNRLRLTYFFERFEVLSFETSTDMNLNIELMRTLLIKDQ
jgi:hypothetical protein